MNKEFESGLEFGCMCGTVWYLLFFALSFFIYAKTQSWISIFGVLSIGLLIGFGLSDIVKLFILNE